MNALISCLSCQNPEQCFYQEGSWQHSKKHIPLEIIELIAEDPCLPYSSKDSSFWAHFDEHMVETCKNEIAERIILGIK
jgi:hypothetical protein